MKAVTLLRHKANALWDDVTGGEEAHFIKRVLFSSALISLIAVLLLLVIWGSTVKTTIYDDIVPLSSGEFNTQGVAEFTGEDLDACEIDGISIQVDFSLTSLGLVKANVVCSDYDSFYISILPIKGGEGSDPEENFYDSKLKPYGNSGVYSLTQGSGEYEICVWLRDEKADENHSNYFRIYQKRFMADFPKEEPYLYSNANSVFSEDSEAAAYAHALIVDKESDMEKVKAIVAFVHERIEYDEKSFYDEELFMTADEILDEGTGLCYHFTALTSAMLKSVGIPAREVR